MTRFLHDVGSLLWFDTPGLQDVVILDVKVSICFSLPFSSVAPLLPSLRYLVAG